MVVAKTQDTLLQTLDHSVKQICEFLVQVEEDFFDRYQTAREVLSHLVFWHREYVVITEAMINGRSPHLRQSTFVALNARSVREFRHISMKSLCKDFLKLQAVLADNLRQLPNWDVEFPVKKGCRRASVTERVQLIQEHIESHLIRLEGAQRHGEAWVEAYYPTKNHAHN